VNKIIPIFLFSFLMVLIVKGQSKEDKQIIKKIDGLISEKYYLLSPGCAVLVAKKGQVIYEKGFGTANIELNVPMRPEMIFRIGSMTKQYTAIAILQLVEQGKISLQDSIQKFIPTFPYKGHTITIENLLTHTSGIKDYEKLDAHIPNAIRIDFPVKQLIDSFAILPLDFIPSTKYSYSNSNYFLLGYIIEQVSGKSYKNYLHDNLFEPAGLTNTFYDSPTEIILNRGNGYTKDSANYRNVDYLSMSTVYSAGALLSNVSDVFKWHQALTSYELIKKETLEKAYTPFKLADGKLSEYGYGWFIKDFQGSPSIGHGGAIDGFRGMEVYLPNQDLFITALFNSDNDAFINLFENITAIAIGKTIPSYKDIKLSDAVLDRYVGTYQMTVADTSIKTRLKVYKENGRLFADLSNGTGSHMAFLPQTERNFVLAIRVPTIVDFVLEDGKATKLIWTQQKEKVEGKKIE
jgi:CubicO group peptidase (beta-lactamase class C family)